MVVSEVVRHPVIALCNVLAVALGVAVFLGMHGANRAATSAFQASIDLVAGRAHVEVRGPASGFDERTWEEIRMWPGVAQATPVVEGFVLLPDHPGESLQVLGLDLFTAPAFQMAALRPEAWAGVDWEDFLARENRMVTTAALAVRLGVEEGGDLAVVSGGRRQSLRVMRLVAEDALEGVAAAGPERRFAILDIGWAQQLLGMEGRLSAVQLMLEDPDAVEEWIETRSADLPPGLRVVAPESRATQLQTMIRGYQLNLNALAMVSLLVGSFLIYNTVAASTVRRRRQIGILRAIGASRAQVTGLFLLEALLLGVPGILLGVAAGGWLAGVLVGDVAGTITSRYLLSGIDPGGADAVSVGLAAGYGVLAVVAGAWWPAWQAARQNPVAALHALDSAGAAEADGRSGWMRWLVVVGFALASWGAAVWALGDGAAEFSLVACFFCVLAFAALVPVVARALAGAVMRGSGGAGVVLAAGTEAFHRSLHRTGVTMAALMTAVAMLTGIVTMVHSFRLAVLEWVADTLEGDVFFTPAANDTLGMREFVPEAVVEVLRADPTVKSVIGYREEAVDLPGFGPCMLSAVDPARARRNRLSGRLGREAALAAFEAGEAVLASEPFMRRHGFPGHVVLPSPSGDKRLPVAAWFPDYGDDRGRVYVALGVFADWWGDARWNSVALVLRDSEPTEIAEEWRARWAEHGTFTFYTRSTLRATVLRIFDQTFAVTGVLRTIAVGVAVAGVTLALLALVIERRREIALLRALGGGRGQVTALYLVQAAWIGVAASLVGIICGLVLAVLLVRLVNVAWFGWTIPLQADWGALVAIPLWMGLTAVAAGLYPAWKASQVDPAQGLRTE